MTETAEMVPVARWEGRYIDTYGRGCKTCGWFIRNEDDPDDQQWVNHGHDPLFDINERAMQTSPGGYVPVEDVIYLLDKFDPLMGPRKVRRQYQRGRMSPDA